MVGTEADKARYFLERLAEYRFERRELPHLTFGSGPNKILRLFPDKLPIGVDPIGDRYVFTYLVTRSSPRGVPLVPDAPLHDAEVAPPVDAAGVRSQAIREGDPRLPTCRARGAGDPLHAADAEELRWLFEQRKRAAASPRSCPTAASRGREAVQRAAVRRAVSAVAAARRRCDLEHVLEGLEDQFDRGRASVEFIVISRQYLHLAHLVGVA